MKEQIDITAKVLANLENVDRFKGAYTLGLVRLIKVTDNCYNFEDLCGDMYNPAVNPDIPAEQLAREKRNFKARVNRVGVWDIHLECRETPISDWQVVDAMGGCVGDDWIGSGYDAEYVDNAEHWIFTNVHLKVIATALNAVSQ